MQFYDWLGEKKSRGIRLAVMDMWKPFRNATTAYAPQAAILFDKFHIMRHLGGATWPSSIAPSPRVESATPCVRPIV